MSYEKEIEGIHLAAQKILDAGESSEFLLSIGINELLEDYFICDCTSNYGKRCLYPHKYRTTGCNGKEKKDDN